MHAAVFTLVLDNDSRGARNVAFWANLRARWLRLPYGAQGLLISRFLYDALGGYAEWPLMEDIDIVRRIGRNRLHVLPTRVVASADKYEHDGYARRAWLEQVMLGRFLMGADPAVLAQTFD